MKNKEVKSDSKKKYIIKIIIIALVLYLLFALYKFISLTYINNIGNSFSEDSYRMMVRKESNVDVDTETFIFNVTKVKNKIIEKTYSSSFDKPYLITYIDIDKTEIVELTYQEEYDNYIVSYDEDSFSYDEDKNDFFESYRNLDNFRDYTDSFKYSFGYKLSNSLNPFFWVNPFTKKVILNIPFQLKHIYYYNNDGLLMNYYLKDKETGEFVKETISYDYVPEHFNNEEIKNPLTSGEYEIFKEQEDDGIEYQ